MNDDRLKRLEKSNRMLRNAMVALGTIAVLPWLMAAFQQEDSGRIIKAKGFIVVDDNGRELAGLSRELLAAGTVIHEKRQAAALYFVDPDQVVEPNQFPYPGLRMLLGTGDSGRRSAFLGMWDGKSDKPWLAFENRDVELQSNFSVKNRDDERVLWVQAD